MSKRIRIYTAEDVVDHSKASSCWISRAGKVYDVTGFLNDHPGGDDLILQYAGKDVQEAMKNKLEHEHSDSAYDMLEEMSIGRLGIGEAVVRDGSFFLLFIGSYRRHFFTNGNLDWEAPDDFHPEATDSATDFEKNEFLDLRKPLLRQVWEANFRLAHLMSFRGFTHITHHHVKQSILSPASTPTPTLEGICTNVRS